MHSMSLKQALDIWHELELAFQNENSFGGRTAEIYAYRMTPSDPSLDGGGIYKALEDPQSMFHQEAVDRARQTKRDLCDLCRYFEKVTGATVRMDVRRQHDGFSIDEWEQSDIVFVHRVHVRVIDSLTRKS